MSSSLGSRSCILVVPRGVKVQNRVLLRLEKIWCPQNTKLNSHMATLPIFKWNFYYLPFGIWVLCTYAVSLLQKIVCFFSFKKKKICLESLLQDLINYLQAFTNYKKLKIELAIWTSWNYQIFMNLCSW